MDKIIRIATTNYYLQCKLDLSTYVCDLCCWNIPSSVHFVSFSQTFEQVNADKMIRGTEIINLLFLSINRIHDWSEEIWFLFILFFPIHVVTKLYTIRIFSAAFRVNKHTHNDYLIWLLFFFFFSLPMRSAAVWSTFISNLMLMKGRGGGGAGKWTEEGERKNTSDTRLGVAVQFTVLYFLFIWEHNIHGILLYVFLYNDFLFICIFFTHFFFH